MNREHGPAGTLVQKLRVGQKVLATFLTLSTDPLTDHKTLHPTRRGVITYVHPQNRYVRVRSEERGGAIYECFKPWEVQII